MTHYNVCASNRPIPSEAKNTLKEQLYCSCRCHTSILQWKNCVIKHVVNLSTATTGGHHASLPLTAELLIQAERCSLDVYARYMTRYFTRSLGRRQTGTLEQGSPNITLRATLCNSVVALV